MNGSCMRSYMTDTAENNINYVYLDALEKEFFTEIIKMPSAFLRAQITIPFKLIDMYLWLN